MMRFAAVVLMATSLAACSSSQPVTSSPAPSPVMDSIAIAAVLEDAATRYRSAAHRYDPVAGYPRSTDSTGNWQLVRINDWTSGFFPGVLFKLGGYKRDAVFASAGLMWTRPLVNIPRGSYTHDLGFQYNSAFLNGADLFEEGRNNFWSARLRREALEAARLLSARYDPDVSAIKSWNWTDPAQPFPVIVDNMMNLELLFWAARQPEGDPRFREIAIRHARTTAAHHIRADGGSFHVVVFDPANGKVMQRITHQGHGDGTTWARGQAWLIYGFTMAFRETGEVEFLHTAERVAKYFIDHLPEDAVPCWDFQAPGCPATAKRDASAAAIAAAGLIELSTFAPEKAALYRNAANKMLLTLSSPAYRNAPYQGNAILKHAVGHHPRGHEIDVGLIYADYYFVEALLRVMDAADWRHLRFMPNATPRTFTHRGELLRTAKDRVLKWHGDFDLNSAAIALETDADSALKRGPFTVTTKERTPPSGSKNDYVSYAPYWWPDSTKANGLPYIRRDGQVNQALRRDSDVLRWYAMVDAVEALAHQYYFTDRQPYADHAKLLLRTWFIDPKTRMNPHLNYGQAIPGVTYGRGIGIIDTRDLGRLTDAVTLIERDAAWTASDRQAIRQWFRAYRDWLLNSPHGKDEADEGNNHGTWYDVQVVALSLFLNDSTTARNVLERNTKARIAAQIDSAGKQPLELARTRSLHYSVENLEGFMRLAEMGRHVGVDLWPSLRKAIEFVAPYADSAVKWPYPQITSEPPDLFVPLLTRAYVVFGDAQYKRLLKRLPERMVEKHRTTLLYAQPAGVLSDSLLSDFRSGVTQQEQEEWERYLARSRATARDDRAAIDAELKALNRDTMARAPAGQGFFVTREMTPPWFASAEAKRIGDILLTYQTPSGGWSKRISFTRPRARGESYASENGWGWTPTLDNGATTEQIEFLGRLNKAQRSATHEASIERGIRYLLAAQMPNGCWPQVYPLTGSYHDAITYNDDATINAARIYENTRRGDYDFLPKSVQDSANVGYEKVVHCILRTQYSVNGFKTVWGAQHDPITWQPIKARAYEHASLSGRESAAILDFLMRIPTPSDSVQTAVHAAAAWFQANAIRGYSYTFRGGLTPDPNGGPLWARFNELGTNRPIFSDRDGIVRYNLNEIGEERRRGYGWYTDEPVSTLRRYERWARTHPVKN